MAPWLAERMWLQVLLLSIYLFGFTVAGTWAAREPDQGDAAERAAAVVLCAFLGGFAVTIAVVPYALSRALTWLLER